MKINNETYKDYLLDLCTLLKEYAIEAHKNRNKSEFDKGIIQGYYQVFELLKSQLESFNIDPREVKMDDFDPDDLLYKDKLV